MSETDTRRADTLRLWAWLGLPLLALPLLARAGGAVWIRSLPLSQLLVAPLPLLLQDSFAGVLAVAASVPLFFTLLIWCPARGKKALLCAGAAATLAACAGPAFAAVYLGAAAAAWWALRLRGAAGAALAAACVAVAVAAGAGAPPAARFFAVGAAVTMLFALWSAWLDADGAPPPQDHLLFLTRGVPVNAAGPLYGLRDFTASFLRRPYWEIAGPGAARVLGGLARLAACAAAESWAFPYLSVHRRHPAQWAASVGPWELWAWTLGLGLLFLVAVEGYFMLLQGLTRLCGYEVDDQVDSPWLARSMGEFWRRASAHSGPFFLRYAFYPLRGRLPAPALVIGAFLLVGAPHALGNLAVSPAAHAGAGALVLFLLWRLAPFAYWGALYALEPALSRRVPGRLPAPLRAALTLLLLLLGGVLRWSSFDAPGAYASSDYRGSAYPRGAAELAAPWRKLLFLEP